jgi:flagellar M-ring protein FliF
MDQINKLLAGLSLRQKVSIALVALLTAAGLFAFSRWRRESDFRALYTSMAPEDAAGVVQKLRETGVEYRLGENGASVLVPSARLAESRLALAAAGLPKTGRIGFELFDRSNFGATDFVEHVNYMRALEGELERTVMSMAEVEQARVHLTLPKESIFLDKQQPAKASVMLNLRPGAQVSQAKVQAITNLLASAVEGLAPEAVSVVDMNGNLLNRPRRTGEGDASQLTSESLEVRQQMERDLVAKIRSTLEPLLGADRFRAGASVECDLTSGEQQEESYDPSRSVMTSSQKAEDVVEKASAGGVPGTASNLPSKDGKPPGSGAGTSRRTESVTYASSRIVKQTHIPQGVIRRMSLAVLVDNTVRWEGQGAQRRRILEPPAPETLKTIKDLVAATTGFNSDRGDQLTVESLPFESTLNSEPPPEIGPAPKPKPAPRVAPWLEFLQKNRDVISPVMIGLAVLGVLLRAMAMFGRRRRKGGVEKPMPALPGGAATPEPAALSGSAAAASSQLAGATPASQIASAAYASAAAPEEEVLELATRVRDFAQSDRQVAANVLRLWLQESESHPV